MFGRTDALRQSGCLRPPSPLDARYCDSPSCRPPVSRFLAQSIGGDRQAAKATVPTSHLPPRALLSFAETPHAWAVDNTPPSPRGLCTVVRSRTNISPQSRPYICVEISARRSARAGAPYYLPQAVFFLVSISSSHFTPFGDVSSACDVPPCRRVCRFVAATISGRRPYRRAGAAGPEGVEQSWARRFTVP